MCWAGLLWVRKKFPNKHMRRLSIRWMGSAQSWMRSHLWLGLLSCPFIFFHSGLHLGSGLSAWTMWTYLVVFVTGVLGACLQHFMPRFTTSLVLNETIYGNMESIRAELLKKADDLLEPFPRKEKKALSKSSSASSDPFISVAVAEPDEDYGDQLRQRYDEIIEPYLAKQNSYSHILNSVRTSQEFFADLQAGMPEPISKVIAALEKICKEKRDLDRQSFLHRILQGWLVVHIPASALLIVLGAIHGWKALHYH